MDELLKKLSYPDSYGDIADLKRAAKLAAIELDRWKRIATYLADCHAATAEIVQARKSSSKYDRGRSRSICETAARYLSGDDPGMRGRDTDRVLERLLSAVSASPESTK